jgi:PAS domain S-box-containing protein
MKETLHPEDSFSLKLEKLPVPCVVCRDLKKNIFEANPAMMQLLGEGKDWEAAKWMNSLDPLSREILMPIISGEVACPENVTVNFRRVNGDWIEVPLSFGRIGDAMLLCFGKPLSGNAKDERLHDTGEKLCNLIDLLPIGILVVKSCDEGTVMLCNKSLEAMFAISRDKVIGHSYLTALSSEELNPIKQIVIKACEDDKNRKIDHITIIGAGGIRRILEINIEIINDFCSDDCGMLLVAMDVTEGMRQQEEKTRISEIMAYREENYRLLAENASDLITRHGFEGIILFASNASTWMLGVSPDRMVGHNFEEFIHVDDRSQASDFLSGIRVSSEDSTMTCRMLASDGRIVWVETRARAVKGKHGGMEITCVTRDISERKQSEDRIRNLQNHFTDAIENMNAGIVMYDRDDKLVFCNNKYRTFYPKITETIVPGVPYTEVIKAFIENGAADDSGLTPEQLLHARMRNHMEHKGEDQMLCVGGRMWLQVSDHPTHDGGVVSLLSDVTSLKKMQDELVRQKLFLSSLLDAATDLMFYKDASGVYMACNPAFCKIVGVDREKIVGHTDREFFSSKTVERIVEYDALARESGKTIRIEEWANYPDGRPVCLETICNPVFSADGNYIGLVGVGRDTTERRNSESLLKAESTRLASLVRSIEGGVILMDHEEKVLIVNDGFMSLYKIPGEPSRLVGANIERLFSEASEIFPDIKTSIEKVRRIFVEGKNVRGAVSALRNGMFVEYDFIPIDMGHGVFNYLWHFRDITMRHMAEAELQQRDKLLSGLAQSVRQLLGAPEDFDSNITEAFRIVAETADIERIIIFRNENISEQASTWTARFLYRWSRSTGAAKEAPEYANIPFYPNFSRWHKELSRGVILAGPLDEFPEIESQYLKSLGFESILVAPMFIEVKFWGVMIFDAKKSRIWSAADRGVLRMVADSIGLSIQRSNAHEELNKALADAERLAEEAHKANQAKTDFLASMSHEIRTPLNGIVGYTNLMRNTVLTQRQNDLLHGVDRSTEMLLALINDILDLSKISAGQLTLDALPFCPALAMQDAVAAISPRAQEKNLSIRCDSDATARQVFIGDERRLKQVLLNLVGNAIKFTEKGSIIIKVNSDVDPCDEDVTKPVRLNFSVMDTGIGIPDENLSKLFRPFSQAQSDISRRFGGTGLGLAICKQLVERMGGLISVSSKVEAGSTFSFFIFCPLAVEQPVEVEKQESGKPFSEDGSDLKLKILIADDNLINQEVLSLYIEDLGYSSEVVSSGENAVKAVKNHQVDLVLMDLRMPGMDGIEATKAIRAWEKESLPEGRREARIVALTADALKSDSERCLEMGMDDYLTKPVDPDQIGRIIARFFK